MVEEMNGMTRVKSSLELLSHTATLKSAIEAKEEMERRLEGAGRVSPATSVTGGDRGRVPAASSPSPQTTQQGFALVVSPKDTNRNSGTAAADPGYSIEGYAYGDDMTKCEETNSVDLSPIPSQPAENLSEYLSRGRGGRGAASSAAATATTILPKSISTSASTSFLLKFNPPNKATEALSRREAGNTFFLPGHQDFEGGTLGGSFGGSGGLSRACPSASFGSSSDLASIPRESSNTVQLEIENAELRKLLIAKDDKIAALEVSVASLEKQIADLRQLPTGKISQIPIEDMLQLMREYGSELSDTAVPPRKDSVQKASVVRQFRRWNPTFFEHFYHKNGKWVPKLGKKGELERREMVRAANQKKCGAKAAGGEASGFMGEETTNARRGGSVVKLVKK